MDKLVKTLESLRILQSGDDARKKDLGTLKKEKVSLCNIIADSICTATLRNHPDFPKCLTAAFEAFFSLCDDSDSDVRMAADDCMNRCTKTLLDSHLGRLQVEFYREIKKGSASVTTSSSRLIRAALSRFADTAHLIRPNKRRAYAQNLLPCIGRIAADRLADEAIQESLLATMNKIAPVLIPFMSDQEMKALCKPFLNNLFSTVATARRTAAAALVLVSWNSRNSRASTFAWLLDQLFDLILPIVDVLPHVGASTPTVLGTLLCIRQILAQAAAAAATAAATAATAPVSADTAPLSGEFIANDAMTGEELLSERHVVMVYELLLRFIGDGRSKDLLLSASPNSPTIVTAALEALLQLLRSPPTSFAQLLVTRGSITKSLLEEAILARSSARDVSSGDLTLANQGDTVPEAEMTAVLAADGSSSSEAASGASHDSRSSSSSSSDEDSSDDEADNSFGTPGEKEPPLAPQSAVVPAETSALGESMAGSDVADAEGMTMSASDDKLNAVLARRWRNRAMSPLSQDIEPEGVESAAAAAATAESAAGDASSTRDGDNAFDGGGISASARGTVDSSDVALAAAAAAISAGLVGDSLDAAERPAVHCARLLAARFLLGSRLRVSTEAGSTAATVAAPATLEGRTLSDRAVRVSMKALALGCLAHVASRCPDLLGLSLFRDPLPLAPPADDGAEERSAEGTSAAALAAAAVDKQLMSDVLLFAQHHDPQLQGHVALILGAALCGLAQLPCAASARDKGGVCAAIEGEHLQQTVARYAGELAHLLCSIKNSVAIRLALTAVGTCLPALLWSVHCGHAVALLASLERHVGDSYWLVKVELLDVLAAVDFRAVHYLERAVGLGRACDDDDGSGSSRAGSDRPATSAAGSLPMPSLQDRLLYRVVIYRLLGDDDPRVRHAAARCLVRVLPNLFFADDSALHDPVVAHAQCKVAGLLSPAALLLGSGSKPLPTVVHGLTPYYAPAFDRRRGADELRQHCSLSRLVSTLLAAFAETSSRSLKVGICHALCLLSQHYATTRYAAAWGCACGSSLRARPSADPSAAAGAKDQPHQPAAANRVYQQPATSTYSGRPNDVSMIYRSVSVEEPKMSGGGGPLSLVLSLLSCSTTFALDLVAHADALQLAGNLFAGAACSSLMSTDGKKQAVPLASPEQTKTWPALQDRSLVPAVEKLLGHVARVLNILTQIIEDVTPGMAGVFPKTAVLAAIQTASQAAVNSGNTSPLKKLVAATRSSQSPDNKTGSGTPTAAGRQAQQPGTPNSAGAASGGQPPPKTPKEVEKELKTKREVLGSFQSLPHYMKIYEVLRGAYSNYKVSLDLSAADKFSSLLGVALEVLGQILEVASLDDTAKCAEELLAYLKTAASIDPTKTMAGVHQLLKAMFGTNLASQCSVAADRSAFLAGLGDDRASRISTASSGKPGVYNACFAQPYACLSQSLATGGAAAAAALAAAAAAAPGSATVSSSTRTLDDDAGSAINVLRRRIERKTPLILKPESKIDKGTVAAYIRLFEPLVIRALKAYMVTSSTELQRQVLDLLTQLVQLRVNYCLLDHEQIFLGFVIKQVEMIGEGPQGDAPLLISSIFGFLVSLSYEKFHSKNVIGMPKIIQLCDGMLASGQDPRSYAIPALDMIVYDLFLTRGASASKSPDGGKDLDAQREVVVSMLLRLASHHEVAELLIIVLHQCFKESEDKWKKMSRLVVDTMLPLLAKQKVNADTIAGLQSMHRLMQAVSPSVYRPVDAVLKAMFAQPADLSTTKPVQLWLSAVLVLLRVLISQGKEEVMLSRLSELRLSFGAAVPTYGGGGASSCTSVASAATPTPGSVTAAPVTAAATASILSGAPASVVGLEKGFAHGQAAAISALMYDSRSSNQSSTIQQPQPEDLFASFLVLVIGYVSARLEADLLLNVGNGDEHAMTFTVTQLSHLMLYASYMFQSGHFRRVTRFLTEHLRDSTSPFYYQIQQLNEKLGGGSAAAARYPLLVLQWRHLLILLDFDDQSWWYDVVQSAAAAAVQAVPSSPAPTAHDIFEAGTTGAELTAHDSAAAHGFSGSGGGGGEDALFESTTSFEGGVVTGAAQSPPSVNEELIRRGTLMLFCDYVVDNLQHAEQTTWLIVNHVSDLVDLCCEVPVQDFISAVHRNPAASGLFVHAVHSRYQFAGKRLPSRGKRALACLRSAHTSQSGALLALLLDKFLLDEETRHTSLARLCDSVACRRLEILLAEPVEQVLQQLAPEDVKRLLYHAKSPLLAARHCRLLTLLERLAAMLQPFGSPSTVKVSGSESESDASAHAAAAVPTVTIGRAYSTGAADEPAQLPPSGSCTPLVPVADKESFLAVVVAESCHRTGIWPEDMSANASVCASLLGQLEYSDIVATMAREDFQLSVLAECMETSVSASTEFLQTSQEGRESGAAATVLTSSLFRASQDTVLSRTAQVAAVISTRPSPSVWRETSLAKQEVGIVVTREAAAFMHEKNNTYLVAALGTYLGIMRRFSSLCGAVPERSWHVICKFVVFTLGAVRWQLLHHRQKKSCSQHVSEYLPSVHAVKAAVTVLAEVLHHDQLFAVLCTEPDGTDEREVSAHAPLSAQVATVILALHEIMTHYMTCIHGTMSPEENRSTWRTGSMEVGFRASELVQCLSTHLSDKHDCLPSFLRHPLASAIQGLTRHPFVSCYAHIPLRAWTAGLVTMVSTQPGVIAQNMDSEAMPVLSNGALQDAALLKEYAQRVNGIGWCSRQQFEETWVTFLQFVSASSIGQTASNDEQATAGTAAGDGMYGESDDGTKMEQTVLAVVALRAIIGLLMRTAAPLAVQHPTMWPWTALSSNAPAGLQSTALAYFLGPAGLKKRLAFMDTVSGLKLQRMHKLIELQLKADVLCCGDNASDWCMPDAPATAAGNAGEADGSSAVGDLELSSTSLLPLAVMEKSETEIPEKEALASTGPQRDSSFRRGGGSSRVDVQSCLRLLTDTFGDWLAAAALTPASAQLKQPLMLINEAVRTLTILSDLFVTTNQYEWMYDVFSNLQKSQYAEDELTGQYIIHGLAKSSASVISSSSPKLDGTGKEKLSKVIEQALKSNHVPTKMSALSGSIYLLGTRDPDVVRLLLPVVVESARQQLDALDRPIIFSEDNSLVLWSAVFYLLETFPDHVKDSELRSQAIEVAIKKMNAQEENMTARILSLLVGSLERLVIMPGFLSADERDMLAKSACDRLSQRHPQHALIALRLLLSCMYSEPTRQPNATQPGDVTEGRQHAMSFAGSEGDIVARMEQITVLFDRIRKGYPHEAQVVAQLLPTLLNDFFTIQDVMNKVIGEFLSSQQPHPQLLARVVFKVFEERIVVQQELPLVQDWVMLSLGNFTQRTPLSMALWSLACFFVSASTNQWLRAMFPHVVSSMGRTDGTGERMFLTAALDFYFRLPSDAARRSFVATFQAAAAAATDTAPYSRLLLACSAAPAIGSLQQPSLAAQPT